MQLTKRQHDILTKERNCIKIYTGHRERKITIKHRWMIFKKDEFKCSVCFESDVNKLTIDHIVPVVFSGEDCLDNYCTLCANCNLIKKHHSFLNLLYLKIIRKDKKIYNLLLNNENLKNTIFDKKISYDEETKFYSATDLCRVGNIYRLTNNLTVFDMSQWFQLAGVKEFIGELEKKYRQVKISGRGRGNHTWVHPLLFIDMALAISPAIKVEVYEWIYGYLLEYRNDSGDSYKKMCGLIYLKISNKSDFKNYIVETEFKIQKACGVSDWQTATEKQLKLRDTIHNNISLLSDVLSDINQAVRIGIEKSVESKKQIA